MESVHSVPERRPPDSADQGLSDSTGGRHAPFPHKAALLIAFPVRKFHYRSFHSLSELNANFGRDQNNSAPSVLVSFKTHEIGELLITEEKQGWSSAALAYYAVRTYPKSSPSPFSLVVRCCGLISENVAGRYRDARSRSHPTTQRPHKLRVISGCRFCSASLQRE